MVGSETYLQWFLFHCLAIGRGIASSYHLQPSHPETADGSVCSVQPYALRSERIVTSVYFPMTGPDGLLPSAVADTLSRLSSRLVYQDYAPPVEGVHLCASAQLWRTVYLR